MRVLVVPAGLDASAHLRLIWPACALGWQGLGLDVQIADPDWSLLTLKDRQGYIREVEPPEGVDVLVLQRIQHRDPIDAIPHLQAKGIAVVVDVDDDFASIDPRNSAHEHMRASGGALSFANVAASCRLADLVTTSTPELARIYGQHGRVQVIPNRLPRRVFDHRHMEDHDPLRIGWPGSIATHPRDLQVTRGAVARTIRDAHAQLVNIGPGGTETALSAAPGTELATGPTTYVDWYPTMAEHLDIGIVPLADTRFSRAKSALKLLELSALAIPAVATPTPDNLRIGTAIYASKPKDWTRHLKALINDESYRRSIGEAAREVALEHILETHAGEWWEAWALARTHHDWKAGAI